MKIINYTSYQKSIPEALDAINAKDVIAEQSAVLIKPNLVNDSPHPVTTSPECCEAVIEYIREYSDVEVVIAEGTGDSVMETDEVFKKLGYCELAEKYNVRLIDLNHEPLKKIKNDSCTVFPEIYLPEITFSHYIISVPVLKAHSLATITGTLKNMMGFAPPKYYSGHYGSWKKAVFHKNMQQSIIDLNQYRTPDFTLMDASVGLADFHLGGAECSPHVNKIIAGHNPVEVDRKAAELLGFNWHDIPHLCYNRIEVI